MANRNFCLWYFADVSLIKEQSETRGPLRYTNLKIYISYSLQICLYVSPSFVFVFILKCVNVPMSYHQNLIVCMMLLHDRDG